MILINGEERSCIEVADRGFQYGDGVFETVEIHNGVPLFLSAHLRRLIKGCERLSIPADRLASLEDEARRLAATWTRGVLKIQVTRGSDGRGYRPPEPASPNRVLSLHPFPNHPSDFRDKGIAATVCKTRLGSNPTLAGIKHMNRLEQILGRSEWSDPDIQEGLMLDEDGNVIEGTMSNVFVVKDGQLYTPALDRCGVEGIIRNLVLEHARRAEITAHVRPLAYRFVEHADELFLTNSLIGVWPIRQILDRIYRIGPTSRLVANWLEQDRQREWVR